MRVLLLQDVYKVGRAGDVKRVADGFGRNYLLPQGLATLATPAAMKQAEHIRVNAATSRSQLNKELGGVAEKISRMVLTFPAKAGETGKLYGSITAQMVTEAIVAKGGVEIDRRQVDLQPIRTLGEHKAHVRLTIDLIPTVRVIVYREGETPDLGEPEAEPAAETESETEAETPAPVEETAASDAE